MMDSEDVNVVISSTPTKRRQFSYPESDWSQTNSSPRDENTPSLDAEPVDSIRPSSQILASNSSAARTDACTPRSAARTDASTPRSAARTDASSSRFAAPHVIVSAAVGTPTLNRIQPSVSCNKNGPSGRKRKLSDRETEEEKKKRTKERCRNHVHTRATQAPTSTMKATCDTMETDAMRYGNMLGYNMVPDYTNYLVVRSAYGYGDISHSSAITRSPESLRLCHHDTSFERTDKIMTPRDKVDQPVRNGGCPRHNTRSDPNDYLVVQSVYGYGNISQSSSIKREGVQFTYSNS